MILKVQSFIFLLIIPKAHVAREKSTTFYSNKILDVQRGYTLDFPETHGSNNNAMMVTKYSSH